MRTQFDATHKEFSDKAHRNAKQTVYPALTKLPISSLDYEVQEDILTSETWQKLDGEMGIDRILKIKTTHLKEALEITVQERFRKPQYRRYQDITITEYNNASGMVSELYKLKCHYFVYGYYDDATDTMLDCIVVNVPNLLLSIASKQIKYKTGRNDKQQDFITITFDDLHKANLVTWQMKNVIRLDVVRNISIAEGWRWVQSLPTAKQMILGAHLMGMYSDALKALIKDADNKTA